MVERALPSQPADDLRSHVGKRRARSKLRGLLRNLLFGGGVLARLYLLFGELQLLSRIVEADVGYAPRLSVFRFPLKL
jgi:hypothetical protein